MSRGAALEPANIVFGADGLPQAPDFDDNYHSDCGALGQARHVFLGGCGLPGAWAGRERFCIFETGFGLGTNFLATWQAWRDDPRRPAQLHFFSVEKHPAAVADLERAHRGFPGLGALSAQLRGAWPPRLAGFHRLHFDGGRVHLTLLFGDARRVVGQALGRFDAFYLDGFSPQRNPELWSEELMAGLAWLAAPGAACATYTIARNVRDALAGAGFDVELRPGFGDKRDMLAGRYVGPCEAPAIEPAPAGRIAVVGAGIAGISVAERLAARGREVLLLESQPTIAQGATGNKAAVMLPVLALDETRLTRLNRAAFLYALRRLAELGADGHKVDWSPCGVLQIPRSDELGDRQARIVAEHGMPPEFVRMADAAEAERLAGVRTADGGWWFPSAGWISPVSLSRALLAAAGERVTLVANAPLGGLEAVADGWRLIGEGGRELGTAAAVVLAHSHGMLALPQAAQLPLRCFRGQVTHIPSAADAPPRCVVCRDGYLTPPIDGWRCVGASFQRSRELGLTAEEHEANLTRLEGMLPGAPSRIDRSALAGRAGLRPVSPDKLPMLGTLPRADAQGPSIEEWPRWPGLYLATGYGARGLVWSHLMAELLASRIAGEPAPLEADLAVAVDPARFPWKGTV
ncbi:MAG TPA: bifunctional tRNA (5-methylaminomethyl-2-thiouridine)(34)-methyltransferase MnmD/FAD-dependent 5-carboxymethylaminomethyl-2-thiouridine(34) oxidoreductase MnmC [Rhodocyclaceae bacterium]